MSMRRWGAALGLGAAIAFGSADASAFCGFYISGADAKLFNNATLVVLMRDGLRTVLSMQNNYEGPPEDFAMVVPVPVVLQESNVKTLPREVFTHIDQLAAPRLVEYWEQDPCAYEKEEKERGGARASARAMSTSSPAGRSDELGVTIEAKFEVGEYQILILSAKDSSGLDTYLRENKYRIPEGAEAVLRPYVESGMKFFVAKVDVQKVKLEERDGKKMAMLSPLRFHYDSDQFALPVRLGLLNSNGTQDLLVHILAIDKRYEVANYPNVTIPTNLDVAESARDQFGAFYAALFDKTLEKNPKAVVTEYAWAAQTCDPCPGPAMNPGELVTLGADVLYEGREQSATAPRVPQVLFREAEGAPSAARDLQSRQWQITECYRTARNQDAAFAVDVAITLETDASGDVTTVKLPAEPTLPEAFATCLRDAFGKQKSLSDKGKTFTVPASFKSTIPPPTNFTLTRLHARYGKESLGEDLIFKEATPITGGREVKSGGQLEHGSSSAKLNNFQGRYAIRHPWTGKIDCKDPRRGIWGGPPKGTQGKGVTPALDLAFAKRDVSLMSFLKEDVPELDITGIGKGLHDDETLRKSYPGTKSWCSCRAAGADDTAFPASIVAVGLVAGARRLLRRRRRS